MRCAYGASEPPVIAYILPAAQIGPPRNDATALIICNVAYSTSTLRVIAYIFLAVQVGDCGILK